ncbi:MAG: amino acid ABC transporter permease [Planctomycetota bacterium]|jgi:polar amino acid transport system permease protein
MRRSNEPLTRAGITVAVVVLAVWALSQAEYDFEFGKVWRYKNAFAKGLGLTLAATAAAYVIGLVVGVGVALARLSPLLPVRHLGDLYVEIVRGTPFLAQLAIAYFGIAPLLKIDNKFVVGAAALGLFAAAYIGEIFRAGIESVDRGQVEAARTLGMGRTQSLRHVVFPQAFKRMIPPLTGELIALTKESSLLFFIGLTELMAVGRQFGVDTYDYLEAYLVVAGLYLFLTVPLSMLARGLERRLGTSRGLEGHL